MSRMVFEKSEGMRFAYRERADQEDDSGWRFFTGHEEDEYLDDSANYRLCNVTWLVGFDSSLDGFIREDYGSVFERDTLEDSWIRVTDWEMFDDCP